MAGSAGAAGGGDVCPEGYKDVDGSILTGQGGCEYKCPVWPAKSSDPIDEDFTDEDCDGSDGEVEGCVFVSAMLGDDSKADGTRFKPYQTIAAAVAHAADKKIPGVCVSGELYNEAITIPSGVSIYGGFDQKNSEFLFRRTKEAVTTVQADATVFLAPNIDKDTHLEGIKIIAGKGTGAGASSYGVRLIKGTGTFFVRWNDITAADGNDGGDGDTPTQVSKAADGSKGEDGCNGCSNSGGGASPPVCDIPGGNGGDGGYNGSTGVKGGSGSAGAIGGDGGTSVGCLSTGNDGKKGADGMAPGDNGSPGGSGASLGTLGDQLYTPADGQDGQKGKNGVSGGGGGGGGGSEKLFGLFCNPDKGGGGGSGGCGGLGGDPGKAGKGGGGSFGILLVSGIATVDGNQIVVGNGGKGGKGGNGATGQQGGSGGPGGGGKDNSGGGGPGGVGSNGGYGGPAGGGGGGPAGCVAYSASKVMLTGKNFCTSGTPGYGGPGGTNGAGLKANDGANGTSKPTLAFN